MKLTKALCAALAVVFLLAAVGLAKEDPAEKPKRPEGYQPRPAGEGMLQHLTKALDLTEAQQAQIKEILQAQRQAAQDWKKEHAEELKALQEQIKKAREEKDAEAIKAAAEKIRKLLEGRMEAAGNVRKRSPPSSTATRRKSSRRWPSWVACPASRGRDARGYKGCWAYSPSSI